MIPLFHRLRLSPVLGFMVVGVAVGPFGLVMSVASVAGASGGTFSCAIVRAVVVVLGLIISRRLVLSPLFRSASANASIAVADAVRPRMIIPQSC